MEFVDGFRGEPRMTREEVAELFKTTPKSVDCWRRDGLPTPSGEVAKLRFVHVGRRARRTSIEEVKDFIARINGLPR